ncbi:MAG: cysteine desulfurase [Planctomycetota bacterium]|nr:MAG: cysteine desulfurase [Planctomycetota bacterium]REK47122.1 MAG: cysteine desulfurase [Planctomycetota bacterium]
MQRMQPEPIYLDNNSTTRLAPAALEAMAAAAREFPGNPASQHAAGRLARRHLDELRERLAAHLGVNVTRRPEDEIVFTSGATEANNLALRGLLGPAPSRLLVSAIEHPSVLEVVDQLAAAGHDVVRLPVDERGVVALDVLAAQLKTPTRLVSVMLGNHETGVRQPLGEIAELCRDAGALLHTDASQAVAKTRVHFGELGVHALTLSAHKFHGPCGVGALVLAAGVRPLPMLVGGAQQAGLRAGTESVALPAGLVAALDAVLAVEGVKTEGDAYREVEAKLARLRDAFEAELVAAQPEIVIVGADAERLPQTSCVAFEPLERQALFLALDLAGVACSTGSACESGSSEPSPVLRAMGLREGQISSALRFSLSRLTTPAETASAARRILRVYNDLRHRFEATKSAVPATGKTWKKV